MSLSTQPSPSVQALALPPWQHSWPLPPQVLHMPFVQRSPLPPQKPPPPPPPPPPPQQGCPAPPQATPPATEQDPSLQVPMAPPVTQAWPGVRQRRGAPLVAPGTQQPPPLQVL